MPPKSRSVLLDVVLCGVEKHVRKDVIPSFSDEKDFVKAKLCSYLNDMILET